AAEHATAEQAPAEQATEAKPAESDEARNDAAEPEDPQPAPVVLHVTTTPSGAVLFKDEFQVCDSTPCEVLAEPNETLVLTAQLGGRRAQAKVLAQRDQKITITLPTSASKPRSTATSAPAEPKMCEVL